jgi:CRP/FNR family nitrogen fixation transcriptional regulator
MNRHRQLGQSVPKSAKTGPVSDGRRQIGAFHLPGDIFGFENGDFHRFTAEAVVETTVCLIKRQSLEHVAKNDPAIIRSLLILTTDNLHRVEKQLLLLGRKTARERVAAFLLEMNSRLTATDVMALPMNRSDIADYLGLTLETVSRAFSEFQRMGYLKLRGRREIIVLNPAGLTEQDSGTGADRTSLAEEPRHGRSFASRKVPKKLARVTS